MAILLIGEAYGEEEERFGAPFIGASGKELNDELEDAGFLSPGCASRINKELYRAGIGTPYGSSGADPRAAIAFRDRLFREHSLVLTNCVNSRPPDNNIDKWFHTKTSGRAHGITPLHNRYPNAILHEGIARLKTTITTIRPSLIICLGDTPLWALSGKDGITRWRGSQLTYVGDVEGGPDSPQRAIPLIPTRHPAAVFRDWPWRPIVVHDLKRARNALQSHPTSPKWDFTIRPDLKLVLAYLDSLTSGTGPLVADTETAGGHITCIGFADGPTRAICIPFLDPGQPDGNYWREEEESRVVHAVRQVLCKQPIIFHNGLYDMQVIGEDFACTPNWQHDTMVAQHVAFPGLLGAGIDPVTGATSKRGSSLSLSFCASMYCSHYVFWKDDGRLWDPSVTPPDTFWRYNCEDCVRTFESHEALQNILREANLLSQYDFQCRRLGNATLRIMRRGIALDRSRRKEMLTSVRRQLSGLEQWFERVLTHPLNTQSNPQIKALLYEDLRAPEQWKGKGNTRALTCNDEALAKIRAARPELVPLLSRVSDSRTLSVLGGKTSDSSKSLLTCDLDPDGRIRTTLKLCGAETFRFSSGPTAFGTGCNLQNILKD